MKYTKYELIRELVRRESEERNSRDRELKEMSGVEIEKLIGELE